MACPPDFVVELPTAWETGAIIAVSVLAVGHLEPGEDAHLISAILGDGTNVIAVTWTGGQRIARMGPTTRWGVQEHYTGHLPARGEDVYTHMWKVAIESLIEAKDHASREMGPPR